eukprot:5034348-Prymnesium_polylepis.1
MLDCGICLMNPTVGASRVRLLARGVEAHGRVDLCFCSRVACGVMATGETVLRERLAEQRNG